MKRLTPLLSIYPRKRRTEMKIIFSGDRASKTIRWGKRFRRIFGRNKIVIMLWDGYPSRVYFEGKK